MKRSACISAWGIGVSASKSSKAVRTSNTPKRQGWRPPYMSVRQGKRSWLTCRLAELEALLATLPLVAITPNTLTDREQLLEELATIRQCGYAVSVGERSLWASAAAAPIRDWSGKPIAAISVLGPSHRLTSEVLPALGEQVKQVAVEDLHGVWIQSVLSLP